MTITIYYVSFGAHFVVHLFCLIKKLIIAKLQKVL